MIPVAIEIDHPDLLVGVVETQGVRQGPADAALHAEIDHAIERSKGGDPSVAPVKAAIRDLLRFGGYKPAGRGKPASEYLAEAAARGEFPRISHMVDALNLVSLETGLPISLIDADRAMEGTERLVIRLGREGERYVFNPAGHEIEVRGLLVVARKDGPALGNPVRDSMATKTTEETRNTLAIIWGSRRVGNKESLTRVCERLGGLLRGLKTEVGVL
jgi:DNA/RNA-binding domain of Phe-tRNA-synthetase-like protein